MLRVSVEEAQQGLEELIEQARSGETIIIHDGQENGPDVRLMAIDVPEINLLFVECE